MEDLQQCWRANRLSELGIEAKDPSNNLVKKLARDSRVILFMGIIMPASQDDN